MGYMISISRLYLSLSFSLPPQPSSLSFSTPQPFSLSLPPPKPFPILPLYQNLEDTITRLLFWGWKRQDNILAAESFSSLTQRPLATSHNRHVPSEDAEAMKSLATDQSKSLTASVWPLSVCSREGGSERRLNRQRVPSAEQLANLVLSSCGNWMYMTTTNKQTNKRTSYRIRTVGCPLVWLSGRALVH